MVEVEVEIGGRRRRVELERAPGGWCAAFEGRSLTVDVAQTPSGWSLIVSPDAEQLTTDAGLDSRTSYEVSVEDRGQGDLIVHVNGQAIAARIIDPRAYVRRGRGEDALQSGVRQVKAPMPGRVIKVLVSTGDRVVARQGLVVVEAMKMENELRAPAEAVVREIRVAEGTSVEAGTILVILE